MLYQCFTVLFALLLILGDAASPISAWEHNWDTLLSSQFIDFGYNSYTEPQAQFLASHYAGVSIEKCSSPNMTEAVVWSSSRQVKAYNPATRLVFYWDMDQNNLKCYAAYEVFMSNPSWWLRDDAGVVVNVSSNQPIMDYSNVEARAWWTNVPLGGVGSPQALWVDGVLADGAGATLSAAGCYHTNSRISVARCDILVAAKSTMLRELQDLLTTINGGVVLQNGLSYYSPPNSPPDFGKSTLNDTLGVMNEHSAVFEQVLPTGALNTTLVADVIETVIYATSIGKVVILGTWPGLLVGFGKNGNPAWYNNTQPETLADWRPVMLSKHTFAAAFFMTIASNRTFMQYELWYDGFHQGVLPCDDAPTTCCAPLSTTWYPNLYKPLGPPLDNATRIGNIWTRHFTFATSTLNLDNPDASSIDFF